MAFCKSCGCQLEDGVTFCGACGKAQNASFSQATYPAPQGTANPYPQPNTNINKSIPVFVLGLIAGVFGLFGGLCVSACYSFGGQEGLPLIMLVGGSIVGLVGACIAMKDARKGSLLELIAAVMMAICVFGFTGSGFMTLVSMALFVVGGLVGLLTSNKS